ncbi:MULTISPECIES: hypothetical protein [Metabacillus]|uniref:hypothetical protein n=1 Tax=Metabacillus TaxID=2675233 RepID=UPI001B96EE4A|nr:MULTISPECIES: hypothetical protein [Metabacillus]MCM3164502.1 hypothetical protein [Metabacillus litoralis]UGB33661.1 hypothetical protein LPC09_25745 [Metabacillus sp. B2-18]
MLMIVLLILILLIMALFIFVLIRLNRARDDQGYIIELNHQILELLKEKQGK